MFVFSLFVCLFVCFLEHVDICVDDADLFFKCILQSYSNDLSLLILYYNKITAILVFLCGLSKCPAGEEV